MTIERLKNGFNLDRMLDMDEVVEASWVARAQIEEYERKGLVPPDWLVKAFDVIEGEIQRRSRAMDLEKLRQLETRLESYKTPSERKREDLLELAALQKKLGMATAGKGK